MPIHTGQDSNGSFYQWGKTGKKYYYQSGNEESRKKALSKAKKQQTAIYSTGWKGDTMKLIKVKKGDADIGSILEKLAKWAQAVETQSNNNWNKLDKERQTFKKIQDFIGEQDKSSVQKLVARIRDAGNQTEAFLNDLRKYEDEVYYIVKDLKI